MAVSGALTLVTVLTILLSMARPFAAAGGAVVVMVCIPVVFLAFLYASTRFTRAWAVEIPECCRTVRGAVETLVNTNYGSIAERIGSLNEDEVRRIIRERIVEVTGVSPERVTEEAQLVKDLGLD